MIGRRRPSSARGWQPAGWRRLPAAQQPPWPDVEAVAAVGGQLAARPGLTTPAEVRQLHFALARVQTRAAFLLQGGDCAEPLGSGRSTARGPSTAFSA